MRCEYKPITKQAMLLLHYAFSIARWSPSTQYVSNGLVSSSAPVATA